MREDTGQGSAIGPGDRLPRWFAVLFLLASATGIVGAWGIGYGARAVGGVLALLSLVLLRWPRSIWTPGPRVDFAPRRQRWGLIAACVLAVFFRVYHVNPPGLWGDDAINGLLAFDVLDGKISSPLELVDHSFSTFHALSNYLIAGAFLVLGPDPLSIRIPGLIVNLLSVPAFYAIVSPLFGPRVAVIATVFFASSPFQIGHAKGLLQAILGQSLALAGLCCLTQGTLRGRRWMLVAAGVPIALALYTYHAAKLVPVMAAFALWQLWRVARSRSIALGWAPLWGGVVFLLCAAPAVVGYLHHPEALTARLSGTGLLATIQAAGSLWPVWDSFWRTLAIFHYQQGPIYHWFGIGTDPGATVVAGFLILHGAVQSLRQCLRPRHALILGWFLIGLLPGFLSSEAPRGYRILNGAPVVFIWAALPLARVLSMVPQHAGMALTRVVALGLVLAVPIVDFNYYFYRVYTSGVFRWFQAEPMVEMARTLRSYGPGWTGYLVADNFTSNYESLRFLTRAWSLKVRDVANLGDVLPVRELEGDGALFMIMRTPFEGAALLRAIYPDVPIEERYDPIPRTSWFDALWQRDQPPSTPMTAAFAAITREQALAAQGLAAAYVVEGDTVGIRRIDRQPLLRGSADVARFPDGTPATGVVWSGGLFIPAEGAYRLRLETDAEAMVSVGAGATVTRADPTVVRVLPPGVHPLAIVAHIGSAPTLRLYWTKPGPTETEALIPAEMFLRFPGSGLLAEYETMSGLRRRIEPFPYHMFFAPAFEGRFNARWSGRLIVPRPGGYRLSVESDRAAVLEVDGKVITGDQRLGPGDPTFAVRIEGIEGPVRLRLYWALGDAPRELIPPSAFRPG